MLDFSKANEWKIIETDFDPTALGKVEANFYLGNGYLGLRSATEEKYLGETRDLLVAGTFNRFSPEEVTELPNAADVTNIEIALNGVRFDLTQGTIQEYSRELNIQNGLLTRKVIWTSPKGDEFVLTFERMVSLKRLHTIAARVSITPEHDAAITFQSGITFVINATHRFYVDGEEVQPKSDINILRRRMFSKFTLDIKAGQTVVLEKFSNIYTSRDKELEGYTYHQMQAYALKALQEDEAAGFDALLAESTACWKEKVWDRVPIEIDGPEFDQLAIRFAQYHMQLMTPAHDNRMNIGAKGLSGEGYKGHTFWDTEIFLLPYFIFNMPEVARSLEEYRYLSLPGAHAKAEHNGYEGAQFPWESAWLDDGEVTPEYMGTDIVTGQLIKVWSGFIEIHITADVAYGVWQYYMCTGDQDFMDKYGYELMLDCAKFWSSRLEPGEDGKLHINDVVGPDEYKEHVDDNAFTNYLVWWTLGKAMEYSVQLEQEKPELYAALDQKLGLAGLQKKWAEQREKIFLTQPNEDGVLPQDSTYLTLQDIDLSKYKQQAHVGGIYKDYNQEQITKIQVSKQADVMVLFLLLEELFPHQVKLSSWDYYEPRCLHDSSLSLSTHSVLACDIGDPELGYEMFEKACLIDLDNANPHSSDGGIHAASYGGLWQCVVWGFGGLRMLGGKLRISLNLPAAWKKLNYTLLWKGQKLNVTVTPRMVQITGEKQQEPVTLEVWGQEYDFNEELIVIKKNI